MIPEYGQLCLVLAFCLASAQAFFPLVGSARGRRAWMGVALPGSIYR